MTVEDSSESGFSASRGLAGLAALPVLAEEPANVKARRARLLPNLESFAADAFAERSRRKLLRVRIGLAVAVAAAVAVGLGVGSWQGRRDAEARAQPALRTADGDVRVEREGRAIGVASSTPFELGVRDRVETNDGRAEVSLVSGAHIALEPKSELDLFALDGKKDHVDERVVLVGGKIDVRVPKLGVGGRLRVGTPDATVTVHGTAFSVEVHPASPGTGSVTAVSVTEGLVSVNSGGREIFLGPGASWSSVPPPVDVAPNPSATNSADDADAPSSAKGPSRKRSTLNEENALFRDALAARRTGHPERAVELVNRLIARYPTSPLLPEAKAERDRAVLDMSHSPAPGPE